MDSLGKTAGSRIELQEPFGGCRRAVAKEVERYCKVGLVLLLVFVRRCKMQRIPGAANSPKKVILVYFSIIQAPK